MHSSNHVNFRHGKYAARPIKVLHDVCETMGLMMCNLLDLEIIWFLNFFWNIVAIMVNCNILDHFLQE